MFKYKNQRVGVFIDVSNMYHSAKNLYGARINFKEILKTVVDGRQLIRAIAYVIKSNNNEEDSFFDALEKRGFEVRMKDLQIFYGGAKKGDWDVGMSMDAVRIADKVDVIVLVTGDGDFAALADYLKNNKGCRVEVIGFERTTSSLLINAADAFYNLEIKPELFLIKSVK